MHYINLQKSKRTGVRDAGMKLAWYSQSLGWGNHPIHTCAEHVRHTHTHTHPPLLVLSWAVARALTVLTVSSWEESQQRWKLQKQHFICRCSFFCSGKLVFGFCSEQTYPTIPLFWLPTPTNRQTFPLVNVWRKKKRKKENLFLPKTLDLLLRCSFPLQFWLSSLASSFSHRHQLPTSSLSSNLTAMDQVFHGIEKSMCL